MHVLCTVQNCSHLGHSQTHFKFHTDVPVALAIFYTPVKNSASPTCNVIEKNMGRGPASSHVLSVRYPVSMCLWKISNMLQHCCHSAMPSGRGGTTDLVQPASFQCTTLTWKSPWVFHLWAPCWHLNKHLYYRPPPTQHLCILNSASFTSPSESQNKNMDSTVQGAGRATLASRDSDWKEEALCFHVCSFSPVRHFPVFLILHAMRQCHRSNLIQFVAASRQLSKSLSINSCSMSFLHSHPQTDLWRIQSVWSQNVKEEGQSR